MNSVALSRHDMQLYLRPPASRFRRLHNSLQEGDGMLRAHAMIRATDSNPDRPIGEPVRHLNERERSSTRMALHTRELGQSHQVGHRREGRCGADSRLDGGKVQGYESAARRAANHDALPVSVTLIDQVIEYRRYTRQEWRQKVVAAIQPVAPVLEGIFFVRRLVGSMAGQIHRDLQKTVRRQPAP